MDVEGLTGSAQEANLQVGEAIGMANQAIDAIRAATEMIESATGIVTSMLGSSSARTLGEYFGALSTARQTIDNLVPELENVIEKLSAGQASGERFIVLINS